MTKKRLFIAINLPERITRPLQKEIETIQETIDPGIRFLSRHTWHITVAFLGQQSADDINAINNVVADVASRFEPPSIQFDRITYGPVGRTPRMIWLVADRATSERIAAMKSELERGLFEAGIQFEQEHRQFHAHLTLARFAAFNRESLAPLDVPFRHSYEAPALEVMESHSQRGDAEYEILASYNFSE